MARTKNSKTRTVPYRRKREGKTNYKKRLALLKSGQSRLVIRKSLNTITTQIIDYNPKGDNVVVSASSRELQKMGWKMHKANIPSAYLTGLLLGIKAKKKKISGAVVDIGLQSPIRGGRVFAVIKGAVDAGLNLNCGEKALPTEDRVCGKHISDYAAKLKQDPQKHAKQFSRCIKQGANPENITKLFDETKKKIMSL